MIVDSSVWLEIFSAGPLAESCRKAVEAESRIVVPTLVHFEVYRKIKKVLSEQDALEILGALRTYETSDLSSEVALLAADLSLELGLAMADSLLLAHSRALDLPLLTLDNDFHSIPGVRALRQ